MYFALEAIADLKEDALDMTTDLASELRRELTDVHALCRALGLLEGAKRQTKGISIRCPWHPDGDPSCSVTLGPDGTVRVHCFACGASGDVFSLIARALGLDHRRDFIGVLRTAALLARGSSDDLDQKSRTATTHASAEPTKLDDERFHALASALLATCPLEAQADVCEYLSRRGLLELALEAGWGALPTNRTEQARLVAALIRSFGEESWRHSGLAAPNGFAWNAHRLVIPYRDLRGSITTVQRRLLGNESKSPKYVFASGRSPSWPYRHPSDHEDRDSVAFVEGAIDVLALRWLCHREDLSTLVLGVPGVEGWRTEWANFARARTAYIAVDADRAGESKVSAIHRDAFQAGATSVRRWRPKTGKDWSDLVQEIRKA